MTQSYKIFIKDVPLLIVSEAEAYLEQGYLATAAHALPEFLETYYGQPAGAPGGLFLHNPVPAKALDELKKHLKYIAAAGGIVWNRKGELLMIYRRGKWDLPKGKVEPDESLETAALREVEEESGVGMLRLLQKFTSTFHIYPEGGHWLLKETHWYEMLSQDAGHTIPQQSEGITQARWIPRSKMDDKLRNTYPSMRELLESVLQEGYGRQ